MNTIKVRMLGTPAVSGKEKVFFPYRKAEALFYYLAVNRQASRDELVNLLWEELDERSAKKNLRNAMYRINKAFGTDILVSPQKSHIMLNDTINIESDLDCFLDPQSPDISAYGGPFLNGFSVPDSENFEEWLQLKRNQYQQRYISRLYEAVEEAERKKLPAEDMLLRVIETDPYEEKAYRILMQRYVKSGRPGKAVQLYTRLNTLLKKELGVQPEAATTALYQGILDRLPGKEVASGEPVQIFYGRHKELDMLAALFEKFKEDKRTVSVIISGEAGIGKTRLKEEFLRRVRKQAVLLEADCYQAEAEYMLKPWHQVIARLADLVREEGLSVAPHKAEKIAGLFPAFERVLTEIPAADRGMQGTVRFQQAVEGVLELLKNLGSGKNQVLVFEDIQWMDQMSKQLLRDILLAENELGIFFLGTCRQGYGGLEQSLLPLLKRDRLLKLELCRFSATETREFSRLFLPAYRFTEQELQAVYRDTEGNPFFLVEYLSSIRANGPGGKMSAKMIDILNSRFADVSEEGMKLLNLLSLFYHRVPVDILTDITGKEDTEIITILEELEQKGIIREVTEQDKISLEFTHQKLRDFIYMRQSEFKRRVLHDKAGKVMESRLLNSYHDLPSYSNLIFHFTRAGNYPAALKYHIRQLNYYVDYNHELFPEVLDTGETPERLFAISEEQLSAYFADTENTLRRVEGLENAQVWADKMTFLHIKGRYLIRQGNYGEGISLIEEMIELARAGKEYGFLLKGYLQFIYYCIQTHRVAEMARYIREAEKINKVTKNEAVTGVLMRLRGLCKMMGADLDGAEEEFTKSICFFSCDKRKARLYALSIAACYNYLGEVKRFRKDFPAALAFYVKALDICREKNVYHSYGFLLTCTGQAYMDVGEFEKARQYLGEAIAFYERTDLPWRRSIAEAYLARLKAESGDLEGAARHMDLAEKFSEKVKNPYETGVVCLTKARIIEKLRCAPHTRDSVSAFFTEDPGVYYKKACQMLRLVPYATEAVHLDCQRIL